MFMFSFLHFAGTPLNLVSCFCVVHFLLLLLVCRYTIYTPFLPILTILSRPRLSHRGWRNGVYPSRTAISASQFM
jgi:hypothetical protein